MKIPFLNLNAQYQDVKHEIDASISRVLRNGQFIGGKEVAAFENKFARYIGVNECIGVNSGTDALILGTRALGLSAGDEIIIPANTFYSAVLAATENGHKPVLADIDPGDNGYYLADVKQRINNRTKAIMVVHLHGRADKIVELKSLIKNSGRKILLIEDACQAHGAKYLDKKVGGFGVFGAFSFYPSKNLGAYGDGGAVTTNDRSLAKKIRLLHEYGLTKKYHHESIGTNSRLDSMQAAILTVKLKYLDRWNKMRQKRAALYTKLLKNLKHIEAPHLFPGRPSIFHIYPIQTARRNALQSFLSMHGITTQIHYPIPLHLQKAFKYLGYKQGDFPGAERAAARMLSLPMYAELTDDQIYYVCDTIRRYGFSHH